MANGMFDNPANAFQQNFNQLFEQNQDAAYSYAMNSSNYDQLQPLLGNNYQSYVNKYNTNQGTMGSSVLNGNQIMYQGADGQTHTYWMGNDASQGWLGLNGAMWGKTLGGEWNTSANPYQAYVDSSGQAQPGFAPQPLDYQDVTPTPTPGGTVPPNVAVDPASPPPDPVVAVDQNFGVTNTPYREGGLGYDANGGYKGGDTAAVGAPPPAVVPGSGTPPAVVPGSSTPPVWQPPTPQITQAVLGSQGANPSQAVGGGHTWGQVSAGLALNNPSWVASQAPGYKPPTTEAINSATILSGFGGLPLFGQGGATGQPPAAPAGFSAGLSGINNPNASTGLPPANASPAEFKIWGQQTFGPAYASNPNYIKLAQQHYAAQG